MSARNLFFYFNLPILQLFSPTKTSNIIADTGSTGHFIMPEHQHVFQVAPTPAIKPITIHMPNYTTIISTHKGNINLPLNPKATKAHLVPQLKTGSLVLIGMLCGNGCEATFKKDEMIVKKNDETICTGTRNQIKKLWDVNIHNNNEYNQQANGSCNKNE